jgi:hypothetical protein
MITEPVKSKLVEFPDYLIYPDGRVYSLRKDRFLIGHTNNFGYYYVTLTSINKKVIRTGVHRLVLMHFVSDIPTDKPWVKRYECHHKDHDKSNNHYTNLEWCTHSENIQKSYDEGYRDRERCGRRAGFKLSEENKAKMALAKHKPVKLFIEGKEIKVFPSVTHAAEELNLKRGSIYKSITRGNIMLNRYQFKY